MTEIQNSKSVYQAGLVIEYWNLSIVCNLMLGIWDFNKLEVCKDNSSLLNNCNEQTRLNEGTYHGQTHRGSHQAI